MPRRDKRDDDLRRVLAESRSVRDIADGWEAEQPARAEIAERKRCSGDLLRFLGRHFPEVFALPWSDDHRRVAARTQEVIERGGLFAIAMPRGSGKTSMAERAALWAVLTGRRRFVVIVAATEAAAEASLDRLKRELIENESLRKPYRGALYPLRRLEDNARKQAGQLFVGERTAIEWGRRAVQFPTMPSWAWDGGPDLSGVTIAAVGLTGAVRGLAVRMPSGEVARPDLLLIDDPQTRESALSPTQTAGRLGIIRGDLLGLAGPGRTIAALTLCTVVRSGDLADQLLDRDTSPQWQGERTSMVIEWPTSEEAERLWQEYLRLRAEGLRTGKGTGAATRFYRANRKAMDHGSRVAWPERFDAGVGEVSALQHAWNLKQDIGPAAFEAEYQNRPLDPAGATVDIVPAAEIAARVNRLPRGVPPVWAERLTVGVDVHDSALVWAAVAWGEDFSGALVDWGVWPRQQRHPFRLRTATPTLCDTYGLAPDAAIRRGLEELVGTLMARSFEREDGAAMRVDRLLVDAGFRADLVADFARFSEHAGTVLPSRGVGIGPTARPMAELRRERGELHGPGWILRAPRPGKSGRMLRFDSNQWKSAVAAALAVPVGSAGALSLWGADPQEHETLGEHLAAEYPTRVTGGGRSVDVWTLRPGHDNHALDCVVMAAAAASLEGIAVPGVETAGAPAAARSRAKVLSSLDRAPGALRLSDVRRARVANPSGSRRVSYDEWRANRRGA